MVTPIRIRTARVVQVALAFALSTSGLYAVSSLTLDPPTGAVSGAPGDTVGWGFTLANSPDYLIVTNSAFCQGTGHTSADIGTAACTTAYAAFGTYTDFIAAAFSSLGISIGTPNPPDANGGPACPMPGTSTNCDTPTLTEMFDGVSMGVGKFDIAAGASGTLSGELLVTYDLFSVSPNNPNFNPDTDTVATDQFFNPAASITVIPEPGTLLLMGPALAGLLLFGLRRRRAWLARSHP